MESAPRTPVCDGGCGRGWLTEPASAVRGRWTAQSAATGSPHFVTAGLLFLGAAVGVRRVLQGGRAGTWGPLLLGAFGVALVAGGVFLADAGLGFPPGAPQTTVHYVNFAELSWHAKLHGVAPPLGFLSLSLACLVF